MAARIDNAGVASPSATARRARPLRARRAPLCQCAAPAEATVAAEAVREAKEALFAACAREGSRASASAEVRGVVAEAIAALVSASGAPAVGAEALRGRWRLRFTTAPDVLALLGLERLSEIPGAGTVRVGDIDQVFDGDASSGTVLNEASFSIPPLVDSVTLRVRAQYAAAPSGRRLTLQFEEAAIVDAVPAPLVDTLLAPPILLSRTGSLEAIARIREGALRFPLIGAKSDEGALYPFLGGTREGERFPGPGYLLLYADETCFVGRQTDGAAGDFVFQKVADE